MDRAAATLAVEANLWAMHHDFARIPGAEIHDEPELLWYTAPSANGWLNGASRSALTAETAEAAIERVSVAINGRGRSITWHVGPTSRPLDLGRRLEAAGFTGEQNTGMALDVDAVARGTTPAGLDIRAARSEADLVDWLLAFDLAFGIEPRGPDHPWLMPFAHLGLPEDTPTEFFVGRVDGEPVATSLAFVGGGAVGLYGVGTIPTHRGRGYGAAITVAGVDFGTARGEGLAILHATEMGAPVYRRIGFQTVCETYSWRRAAPA